MTTELQQRYQIKGAAFGARGCSSCSCNPCDCNPCNCGDEVHPPHWRMSGYYIQSGTIDGKDAAGLSILSLAQPVEAESTTWQEVLLVAENVAQERIDLLLAIFEDQLESFPAEIEKRALVRKAVYAIPMRYTFEANEPQLEVAFVPTSAIRLRAGGVMPSQSWNYRGPVAQRARFALSSS